MAVTTAMTGCATTTASLRTGQRAEQAQDYDRAVAEYTAALKKHPNDRNVMLSLERAKLRSAQDHLVRARRLEATGKLDEALVELQIAGEMNPGSSDIDDALRSVRTQLRTKVLVSREGKTQLETLINNSQNLGPAGLDLPTDVRLPASLVFRDAGSRDVYTAIARFANLNIVFDSTFRDERATMDLSNVTLDQALGSVASSTHTFYKVTAPRTVTIIPDTAAKRREYEEDVVRTFYLSNADLKETIDLLRIVVDARRIAPLTANNALTIKDTPERVAAAARIIQAIDKARPEVVIDVELLEVNRTRLLEYGLQFASPTSSPTGIDGTADVNRTGLTLQNLRNLSQSDIILTNLPTLYYRLLKSDSNTRTLANPQLRTSEGVAAQAKFGEQVPVPVTTFSPIATGGVAQQPITSFQYQNIGVNIDITPRTHHDDDVSLSLKVVVTSLLSTSGFGGLPTFGNREITTSIRLRDGETNLLAGLITDDERTVADGIPGLSDLPIVGRLFAHNHKDTQQTDIVLTLTPHIIRVLDLSADDLRPFRVSNDANAPLIEMPNFPQTPPVTVPGPPVVTPLNPGLEPQPQQPAQPIGGTLAPSAPPQQSPPANQPGR